MHLNGEIRLQTDGIVNQWRNNIMEPNNIFKGAFLGDLIICKDGTELLYACTKDNKAVLANGVGPKGKARLRTYNLDGTSTDCDDGKRIIGKIKYKKNFEEEIVYFEEKH